jgi:hypothetical protein
MQFPVHLKWNCNSQSYHPSINKEYNHAVLEVDKNFDMSYLAFERAHKIESIPDIKWGLYSEFFVPVVQLRLARFFTPYLSLSSKDHNFISASCFFSILGLVTLYHQCTCVYTCMCVNVCVFMFGDYGNSVVFSFKICCVQIGPRTFYFLPLPLLVPFFSLWANCPSRW